MFFQPNLMFVGKAGAYPRLEQFKRPSSNVIKVFTAVIKNFCNKLYCLSLASLSSLSNMCRQVQEPTKEWSTLKVLHSVDWVRLERVTRCKHSSLLRTVINYTCMKVCEIYTRIKWIYFIKSETRNKKNTLAYYKQS